jgi:hypothetical protein
MKSGDNFPWEKNREVEDEGKGAMWEGIDGNRIN